MHAGWTYTQANTQFQTRGGASESKYWTSYGPIQYVIPIERYPFRIFME